MRKQPRESRRGTNVAAGNANAGPGGDTATVAQSKARAEHGRGPGTTRRSARRAAARQMVKTCGACEGTASSAQPSAAVAQAYATQRAGKPTVVVTTPSAQPGRVPDF